MFSFEFPAFEVPCSKFKKAAISKCFLPVLYPIIDNPRYTDMIKIYWREVGSTENDQHQKMINMAKSENDQHLNLWLLMKKFKFFY